ncbi:MAG: hypothetical protein DRO52_02930, partial [Candidatus Hecatellales archaeon]
FKKSEEKAFETWLRDSLFPYNPKVFSSLLNGSIIINTSSMLAFPSTFWYAQGPITCCLNSVVSEYPAHYRLIHTLLKPLIRVAENRFLSKIVNNTLLIIANSKFSASLYNALGLKIRHVIYPPLDDEVFHPTSPKPSSNYALTYFGKETIWSIVKSIADHGVKIKAFGGKAETIPKSLLNHRNIQYLGRVDDGKLADLYTNALFTLFTYTHEPFGYIPVESMACGTPILTFQGQGPAESVIHDHTGWLCRDESEIVTYALKIWRNGYPSSMRNACRRRAALFSKGRVADEWMKLFRQLT